MSLEKLRSVARFTQIKTGPGVGRSNQGGLCRGTRHGDTGRLAVLVDSGFPDDALNVIPVSESLAQSLENDSRNTLSTGVTVSLGIPHTAATIRRQHLKLALRDVLLWAQYDV